jgi:drug/metabolite transporter (DMT)-like permease
MGLLAFGAICISFAPVFVKLLGHGVMGPTAIGAWRMGIAGIVLLIVALVTRRRLLLPREQFWLAVLAGFWFSFDLGVWHRSVLLAGAGLATILGNTQVFNTAVFSYFLFKERPTIRFYIAALFAMVGVVLLVGVADNLRFTDDYILGIILGLMTGVFYSLYVITLKHSGNQKVKPDVIVFIGWVCLFGFSFMSLGSLFEAEPYLPPDGLAWLYLVILAVIVQVVGWYSIFTSLSKVETSRAGLVLLLQPTFASVWGVLMFGEHFSIWQIVGAAVTLFCIYYGSIYRTHDM